MIIFETDDYMNVRNSICNQVWNVTSRMELTCDYVRVLVYIRLLVLHDQHKNLANLKSSKVLYM